MFLHVGEGASPNRASPQHTQAPRHTRTPTHAESYRQACGESSAETLSSSKIICLHVHVLLVSLEQHRDIIKGTFTSLGEAVLPLNTKKNVHLFFFWQASKKIT